MGCPRLFVDDSLLLTSFQIPINGKWPSSFVVFVAATDVGMYLVFSYVNLLVFCSWLLAKNFEILWVTDAAGVHDLDSFATRPAFIFPELPTRVASLSLAFFICN